MDQTTHAGAPEHEELDPEVQAMVEAIRWEQASWATRRGRSLRRLRRLRHL